MSANSRKGSIGYLSNCLTVYFFQMLVGREPRAREAQHRANGNRAEKDWDIWLSDDDPDGFESWLSVWNAKFQANKDQNDREQSAENPLYESKIQKWSSNETSGCADKSRDLNFVFSKGDL